MYQRTNVCIETYNGLLVVDGWILKDEHWNGWAIPVFAKDAADAIAEVLGMEIDGKTYRETPKSAGDTDYFEEWTLGENKHLGEETVAIGAASWCWSVTDDEELKNLKMNVIDRRENAHAG